MRAKISPHRVPASSVHPGRKCPVDYEIRDGRMIVEGEDCGDAQAYLDAGEKLRSLVVLFHEIKTA